LHDNLGFQTGWGMAGVPGEQRERIEARRVDAAEAEPEFRHVLIGGDREQIDPTTRIGSSTKAMKASASGDGDPLSACSGSVFRRGKRKKGMVACCAVARAGNRAAGGE
jgi:hypothetical protein